MSDPERPFDNPNVILEAEIAELGLEEGDESMGPSWDEVEEALKQRENKNGKQD